MYLDIPIPAWFYLAFTQRWYVIPILMVLITSHYTSFIEDVMGTACNIPEYPSLSSSFVCHFVRYRTNDRSRGNALPSTNINTLQDVLVRSFFSKDITSAELSIGDVVFLVESSQLDRHKDISRAVNNLKDESILLTIDLLGLRAETSYHFST